MNQHKYISNLSIKISKNSSSLTKMEKSLLKKLMSYNNHFNHQNFTISNLATMMNTSRTSIHRLSKKLGYASFALFKEDFFYLPEEMIEETSQDLLVKMSNTIELVKKTISKEMLQCFTSGKTINIYSMGINHYLAEIYQIKFQLANMRCEHYYDSRYMRLSSKNLNRERDIVLFLSSSGNTAELIEVMNEVNKKGVEAFVITENSESSLVEMGAGLITIASSYDYDSAIDTRLQTHIALDILFNELMSYMKEEKHEKRI